MLDFEHLHLLQKTINKIYSSYGDLSTDELERLYKKDIVFRKNIQLEVKDMMLIAKKLERNLKV